MPIDAILEAIIGLLAVIVAMLIYLSRWKMGAFLFGFVLIAASAIFDVSDEFVEHFILDLGSKGLFILGLVSLIIAFKKSVQKWK